MTSGLSGLQVRGAVRLFSFLKLYELRELKEMAIVAHVDQGPKQSMRKDGWIRPCPQATAIIDIILTKLKVKRQVDKIHRYFARLGIEFIDDERRLDWMITMSRYMIKCSAIGLQETERDLIVVQYVVKT